MKLSKYIKDKLLNIFIYIIFTLLIILILIAFKLNSNAIIIVSILLILLGLICLFLEYFKKITFYNELTNHINKLDQKYLVQEIINKPEFYEGQIFYNALYEIDKSMIERINKHLKSITDFKEYIEMWIHEVKIPISSLILMSHNDKKIKYINELQKIDDYIEQVLYYIRSEVTEKDFLIKETNLKKVINDVVMKNKDNLILNDIEIITNNSDHIVLTDSKWLEFILNQIISNSIKYKKDNNCLLKIEAQKAKDRIILTIYDNGIGIQKEDLPKVFEKSFTGNNGRIKTKSTGMGLYIVKKLCDKLSLKIEIESTVLEYTKVRLIFPQNDYYKIDN